MKLFLSNLFHQFLKKPFYPLAIIVTVAFSAAIFVIAFSTKDSVVRLRNEDYAGKVGSADIVVKASSSFVFSEDLETAIGDLGTVYGNFSIPIAVGTSSLRTCLVTELDRLPEYNNLEIMEQIPFSKSELDEIIIITDRFARENYLTVGDTVSVDFLGEKIELRVGAIADERVGFARTYCLFLNMNLLVNRILNEYNIYFDAGDAVICSSALVVCKDGVDVDALVEKMQAHFEGTDLTFSNVSDYEYNGSQDFLNICITMFIVTAALCSIVVILSILGIYFSRRMQSIAIFRSVGVSMRMQNALLITECMIYGLIGAFAGTATGVTILNIDHDIFIHVNEYVMTFADMAFAVLLSLGTTFLGIIIPILKLRKSQITELISGDAAKKTAKHKPTCIVLAVLLVASFSLFFILEASYYAFVAIFAVAVTLALLYILTPYFLNFVGGLCKKACDRSERGSFIVLKISSIRENLELKNISKLLIVSVVVCTIIASIIGCVKTQVSLLGNFFRFDNAVIVIADNYSSELAEIQAIEDVEDVIPGYFHTGGTCDYNNENVLAVNGDVSKLVNLEGTGFTPYESLGEDEIIISQSTAIINKKRVGDTIDIIVADQTRTYRIVQIIDTPISFNIVSLDSLDVSPNFLFVCSAEGKEKIVGDAMEKSLSQKLCYVLEKDYFLNLDFADSILDVGISYVWFVVALVTFALVNMFLDYYQKKKHEYELLSAVGANKSTLALSIVSEITFAILVALFFSIIFYFYLTLLVYLAGISVGISLKIFAI